MSDFENAIISIYGEEGKIWLEQLPETILELSSRHGLSQLERVSNLSYNYVLTGFQKERPVVLKLSIDSEALHQEAMTLKCFAEKGVVRLLAEDKGMMLLERVGEGVSLKSYFPDKENEAIQVFCSMMRKLHNHPIITTQKFPHIKDLLSCLDKDWEIPNDILNKARRIREYLLNTGNLTFLLHGDLHHENILFDGKEWVVIDPKGVFGDPAYEVAAFVRNPIPELLFSCNPSEVIKNRINAISQILNIPQIRLNEWCFVHSVLSWIWALEDKCDTNNYKNLTLIFDKYC